MSMTGELVQGGEGAAFRVALPSSEVKASTAVQTAHVGFHSPAFGEFAEGHGRMPLAGEVHLMKIEVRPRREGGFT